MVGVHIATPPARWTGRQFHVLPVESHQHRFLVDAWDTVRVRTEGQVDITVCPNRNGSAPGVHDALEMLVDGELEFFTYNGNAIAKLVPPLAVQGIPYAFQSSEQVHRANDGALGAYLSRECEKKGLYRFQRGLFENGFRQTLTFEKAINHVDDLQGVRIRTPAAEMFNDVMRSLGAQPVIVNILRIHEALANHEFDGHENPLIVMDVAGLVEATKFVAMTNHMWTGFNVIGSLKFWNSLPADIQTIIDEEVTRCVATQRAYTVARNAQVARELESGGATITRPDNAMFKERLTQAGFYKRWKADVGETAWRLLEESIGHSV